MGTATWSRPRCAWKRSTSRAFDFADLKGALRDLADGLDHENLNELPQFEGIETSAENQARYFFEELQKRLPPAVAKGLLYARIWESPTQWAQYGPVDAPLPPPALGLG
jgi:6-pyruvoyltetrahydropterin/6-carboxytetrahydropterin synthase